MYLLSVITAIKTATGNHQINILSRSLKSFRNAGIVYLGLGLFLTPEIYNPVMKDNGRLE